MGSSWLVPVHGQRSRPSHHVREHGVEFYLADAVARPITVTLRPSRGTVSLVSEVGACGNHSAGSEETFGTSVRLSHPGLAEGLPITSIRGRQMVPESRFGRGVAMVLIVLWKVYTEILVFSNLL
jgi:hypothetical protein